MTPCDRRRFCSLRGIWIAGLVALALSAPNVARACGVALILAIDVSSSVDQREYALQTKGLAAAFRAPEVVEAVLGNDGALVMVVYWSGYPHQEIRLPWTFLDNRPAIAAFADRLESVDRRYLDFPTALGRALELIEGLWSNQARACRRRVVDVSGDGVSNSGPPPAPVRDRLAASGVTVNGLVIKGATPDPEAFYREEVVGGPNAFIEIADGYDDYARAIRRKLFRELAPSVVEGAPPPQFARR